MGRGSHGSEGESGGRGRRNRRRRAKPLPPKRKLPLKLIIIAAAALIVVGGGGTGAYFRLLRQARSKVDAKAPRRRAKPVAFLDLPDVLVNLSSPGGDRAQYLKVKIVLEVPDQAHDPADPAAACRA